MSRPDIEPRHSPIKQQQGQSCHVHLMRNLGQDSQPVYRRESASRVTGSGLHTSLSLKIPGPNFNPVSTSMILLPL